MGKKSSEKANQLCKKILIGQERRRAPERLIILLCAALQQLMNDKASQLQLSCVQSMSSWSLA
jgi:hypothetical protein